MLRMRSSALLLAAAFGAHGEDAKVEYKPMSIAALQEFGQLQSGQFGQYPEGVHDEWVDHFGAFVTQSVTIGEALDINVGIGGLFQFQKREEIGAKWGGSQTKYFFVGPTVADVNYRAGSWSLGAGMFSIKYNPDASNLGEYLFRTGAYPTFLWTGGYSFVNNSAVHGLQGIKAKYSSGGFSTDFYLLTETTLAPLYDLSLAALVKYGTPGGLFSVFGGAHMRHLIPIRPSISQKEITENSYFHNPTNAADSRWYTGNKDYYAEQGWFFDRKYQDATNAADSAKYLASRDSVRRIYSQVRRASNDTSDTDFPGLPGWLDPGTGLAPGAKFYELKSTIITVGAALDLKPLLGSDAFGSEDLRLFFEAALLGIKDYPIFYEDKMRRLPVMVGFNFPGFKILDLISLQYEWFNSPWINSYQPRGNKNIATPALTGGLDRLNSMNAYNDVADKDNHSWSLLLRKQVVKGLTLTAQAARDHIRSVSLQTYAGPATDPNELLIKSKDWYWMLQFSVGI